MLKKTNEEIKESQKTKGIVENQNIEEEEINFNIKSYNIDNPLI